VSSGKLCSAEENAVQRGLPEVRAGEIPSRQVTCALFRPRQPHAGPSCADERAAGEFGRPSRWWPPQAIGREQDAGHLGW